MYFNLDLGSVNVWLLHLFVFLGGVSLNLTPCVYPLIPITVSYFATQTDKKRGASVTLPALYVFGMSLTYSWLGTVSALTGQIFGRALSHPAVMVGIAIVMVLLGLSLFDLFDLKAPLSISNRFGARTGRMGAIFMGATVGIVAAPCIGPFILGLLTFIGTRQDPFLGFSLFFCLSLGLGLPYLVLGVFTGSLSKLPRSGDWMISIRKVFGLILFGMALYFLRPLFPEGTWEYGFMAFIAGSCVYLAFFLGITSEKRGLKLVVKGTCMIAWLAVSSFFILPHLSQKEAATVDWISVRSNSMEKTFGARRPVVMYFTADWCIPCLELKRRTFADKEVIRESRRMEMVQVDLTKGDDLTAAELQKEYNVKGVPMIIFVDSQGVERTECRLAGFADAGEVLKILRQIE